MGSEEVNQSIQLDKFALAVMALAREIVNAPLTTGQSMRMLSLLQEVNRAQAATAISIVDMIDASDEEVTDRWGPLLHCADHRINYRRGVGCVMCQS